MNSSLYSHLHFRKLSLDLSQSDGRRRPKLIRIGHLTPYKKLLQQFLLYLRHSELTATYTVDGVEKCRGGQKLYMAAKKSASKHTSHCNAPVSSSLYENNFVWCSHQEAKCHTACTVSIGGHDSTSSHCIYQLPDCCSDCCFYLQHHLLRQTDDLNPACMYTCCCHLTD